MDEPDPLQASLDELYKTGFKAGREAGMREASEIAKRYEPDERHPHVRYPSDAILSAIGGGK